MLRLSGPIVAVGFVLVVVTMAAYCVANPQYKSFSYERVCIAGYDKVLVPSDCGPYDYTCVVSNKGERLDVANKVAVYAWQIKKRLPAGWYDLKIGVPVAEGHNREIVEAKRVS